MSEHIPGFEREQAILFPDTLDDYVDEDNPVRFIDAFVDSLDLEKLGFKKVEPNEMGRPSYNPYDLLKLYVYGYLNQVRSSRKLERECHRNLEVIWMMKKLAPDFKTISNFRKDNIDCIKPVFKEFVYLCKSLDLFGAELVGIDGSKFRALNSKKRNFNEAKLLDKLSRINESIERYLKEIEQNDAKEKSVVTLKDINEKLKRLEDGKRKYELILAKMKESGQKEVSLTDPDSRLMMSNGKLEVCYNAETAVDSKNKMVVDYDVINNPTDLNELAPMAKAAKETLGVEHIDAAADKGFYDVQQIKDCVDNGITPYVPQPVSPRGGAVKVGIPQPEFYDDKFVYDETSDTYTCPAGQTLEFRYKGDMHGKMVRGYGTGACFSCPFFMTRCTRNKRGRFVTRWEHEEILEAMTARLKRADGRKKVEMRKELSEHPFGTMKRAFNQGYLLLKGLRKVKGEMGFTMLAYNMRRAINLLGTEALMASVSR